MANRLLKHFLPTAKISAERSKDILLVNPTVSGEREYAERSNLSAFSYSGNHVSSQTTLTIPEVAKYRDNDVINWVNLDGINKKDVEHICELFNVHSLLVEDIFSVGQRPKVDEVDGVLFCQLNMLYYNDDECRVESEQISLALGENYLLSIQEDDTRDVFDPLRLKLNIATSKLRQRRADYLLYSMLDLIVDNYFLVMEKLANRIEAMEDEVIHNSYNQSLLQINLLRKELIILRRNIIPVRDLIAGIIRSESVLIEDRNLKYFKDINDHIIQAYELSENYRDMVTNIQDLYINNVNLKLNEIMKFIAVLTCLMAPATIIGGIFGMNFDIIPYAHKHYGFYLAIALMIAIPWGMLVMFKRRNWF